VSHTSAREANLLGALSLALADRIPASAEAAALVSLEQYLDGASLDALARVVGLTPSGTVRLVDRLEAERLAVRRRDGEDGRTRAVRLTAAGRRAAARIRAKRARATGEALGALSAAERRTLAALHEKLLGALTTDPASARRICRVCDAAACGHWDGRCPVTRAVAGRGHA
jgi:MarR family transcriptional repressor of emrRAB